LLGSSRLYIEKYFQARGITGAKNEPSLVFGACVRQRGSGPAFRKGSAGQLASRAATSSRHGMPPAPPDPGAFDAGHGRFFRAAV